MATHFRPGKIGELCMVDSGAEKRIIFIETSGGCLRPRQACAIESAAITNPDMTVYVYLSIRAPPGEAEPEEGEGLQRNCLVMDILTKIANVKLIREDLTRHLWATPLETLLTDNLLTNSTYSLQHMSDALRVALLYKYGGIYLDLDVVVFRSLRCLRNMVGQNVVYGESNIENGVIMFDKGHPFLKFYMNYVLEVYNPGGRSSIGPNGFTEAIRLYCNVPDRNFEDLGEMLTCRDQTNLTLLYTEAFYAIDYFHHTRFFRKNFPPSELDEFKTSFLSHVYCAGHGADAPDSSLYAFFTDRFCPSTKPLNDIWYDGIPRSKRTIAPYRC